MGNVARAAIYLHLGATATREQQERVCVEYCIGRHYEIVSVVTDVNAAVALVRVGAVDLVVTAYRPSDRDDVVEVLTRRGVRIEEARPGRVRREFGKLVERLFDRGLTVAEIADITESPTGEIRVELLKRGRGE